jgi:hypothetical protein
MSEPEWPEAKFLQHPLGELDIDAYCSQFPRDPSTRVFGEKSTGYLESIQAGLNADILFDAPKFVVVLREPSARAVSHYRFTHAAGHEPLPIAEALTEESERRPWPRSSISVSPYHYIRRGVYVDYLRPWLERWDRSRMFVAIHERLIASPEALTDLEDFLGVSRRDHDRPGRVNRTHSPMSTDELDAMARLAPTYSEANDQLRDLLDDPIDEWA